MCSKGKREYIQLLWLMLDPAGHLIPQQGAPRLKWIGCATQGAACLRQAAGQAPHRLPCFCSRLHCLPD